MLGRGRGRLVGLALKVAAEQADSAEEGGGKVCVLARWRTGGLQMCTYFSRCWQVKYSSLRSTHKLSAAAEGRVAAGAWWWRQPAVALVARLRPLIHMLATISICVARLGAGLLWPARIRGRRRPSV